MSQVSGQFIQQMENTPRGRILAAAARLFRKKGFERTTVRDLAQEVGIQSGSIFHHFKTKEDILKEVMTAVILFCTERMEHALLLARTPEEQVLALIRCELTSINGDTGEAMAVLIYEWRSLGEQYQKEILKLREHYEALWLRVLNDARAEGIIGVDVDTFLLRRFLTGALGWSNFWYKPDGALDLDGVARQALRLVVKGGAEYSASLAMRL